MKPKPSKESLSPSMSSSRPSFDRESHGDSILAGSPHESHEVFPQTLDQIHNVASQSETLTAFDDYTSPPPGTSAGEVKKGDSQGALSGLYNRFKASVEGVKEIVSGVETASDTGTADVSQIQNLAHSASSSRPSSLIVKSSRQDSSAINSTTASRLQSPTTATFGASSSQISDLSERGGKRKPKSLSMSSKGSTTATASPHLRPLVPLAKVSSSAPASAALAEVNVSAVKDQDKAPISLSSIITPRDIRRDTASKSPSIVTAVVKDPRVDAPSNRKSSKESFAEGPGFTQKNADTYHVERNPKHDPPYSHTASDLRNQKQSDFRLRKGQDELERPGDDEAAPKNDQLPSGSTTPRIVQPMLPGLRISQTASSDTGSTDTLGKSHTPRDPAPIKEATSPFLLPEGPQGYTGRPMFLHMGSKVLNKDFWMKDENAKDCFNCGDAFSTFRRKHHCRICGQIFDAKCTSLIPARPFGLSGTLRVCKPCQAFIDGYDDESSDFSDDESLLSSSFRLQPEAKLAKSLRAENDATDSQSTPRSAVTSSDVLKQLSRKTPTMAIPVTRWPFDVSKRKSTVVEIDSESPVRPGSSRSMKTSVIGRPLSISHRRLHSRHQFVRSFKGYHDERPPFHRGTIDDLKKQGRLPAFHKDSIIDPDLAAYLSDDATSEEEQPNIYGALVGDNVSKTTAEFDRSSFGARLGSRKGRSRLADRSSSIYNSIRDGDDASTSSTKVINLPRVPRRRNMSVSSHISQRFYPSLRGIQLDRDRLSMDGTQNNGKDDLSGPEGNSPAQGFKIIRSASMKGAGAPPIELNNASLHHVRKLLGQLLDDAEIKDVHGWETALVPILLQATDDVNPDVQHGDDLDIRHYVKIKKIPGGRPGDTSYVSGLVFTKNLALKSMPRNIARPSILIITFSIEYARHQQHFMSLDPVIRQEREYLANLVNRIAALKPKLLLVQKNVSGLALEFLSKVNIATAYNVKPSVLEAVSRFCQARIVTSLDKLSLQQTPAGSCASFDLKTYVHKGLRKTYMYLSGCPKELGCTIVLRGASTRTLRKLKKITEFMIYVVYNLKLETCLMRDEFALIPSSIEGGRESPIQSKKHFNTHEEIPQSNTLTEVGRRLADQNEVPTQELENKNQAITPSDAGLPLNVPNANIKSHPSSETLTLPEDTPMPVFYEDLVQKHKTRILSSSPFVQFMQPYLLMRAREQERRVAYLQRLKSQDILEDRAMEDDQRPETFDLVKPEMIHETFQGASSKIREVLHAVHDAEYDKALHNYETQRKQWEAYLSSNSNLFDPFAHQNIAILCTLVCTATGVPCSKPDIIALEFYNDHESDLDFEPDCSLGQFIEDLCYGADEICTSNGCEKKMADHRRQFVNGEGQISITVYPYPCKMRGMQNIILMWSCCRICGNETQVMPMSESTWKYSFGKYLELSFWSHDLHARAGICPHDLHRDHFRYFGFRDMAVHIQYDPITLLEIIVPRTRITWKVENDLRFRNELFEKYEDRLNRFMGSVKARIKSIHVESVLGEKAEACKSEIERLTKRANEDHEFLIRKLRDKYIDSKYYEIIPFNRALRAMMEKVWEWETAFTKFESDFFPSEKDIRRLATLQLKKIFLDRDGSMTALSEERHTPSPESMDGKGLQTSEVSKDDTQLSPEKTRDMLASIIEEDSISSVLNDPEKQAFIETTKAHRNSVPLLPILTEELSDQNMQPLDLAIPADMSSVTDGSPKSVEECLQSNAGLPPVPEVPASVPPQSNSATTKPTKSDVNPKPKTDTSSPNTAPGSGPGLGSVPENSGTTPYPDAKRAVKIPRRKVGHNASPPLVRARSQPITAQWEHIKNLTLSPTSIVHQISHIPVHKHREGQSPEASDKPSEKKISERLGIKPGRGSQSGNFFNQRSASKKKDTKVTTLAKHFEELSREFERERIRERKQRAVRGRPASRPLSMASSKPIIQVYKNVNDAVEEREPSDEDFLSSTPSKPGSEEEKIAQSTTSETPIETPSTESGNSVENLQKIDSNEELSQQPQVTMKTVSDVEGVDDHSDEDRATLGVGEGTDESQIPSVTDSQLDTKLELPKHERSSLLKILTNFWAERSSSGWEPLEYPLGVSEHVFTDSDIIVREDEPSSVIAVALDSDDYKAKLASISLGNEPCNTDTPQEREKLEVEKSLLSRTGTHLRYQFQEGSAKMLCKIFYAEQFEAIRRKCGVSDRIVESLSRCVKWDSKGGKTKSLFLKTLDHRLVLKALSPIESQAFLKFAPAYFQIMSETLFHDLPSVIAKMLGFYQVIIKNPQTGIEFNYFLLVMENLFYDRKPNRTFDLKGSMRNRKIESTGAPNEVLLDENMVEFIFENPLYTREHSKKLLRSSVWNDTLFLGRQNVMDYSLMIGIDEARKELVVGIIDCIRTYTWDKKLESWIKDRGKNRPTVTSPKEYKNRFREAMARYVLQAPNCWHEFNAQALEARPFRPVQNVNGENREVELLDAPNAEIASDV